MQPYDMRNAAENEDLKRNTMNSYNSISIGGQQQDQEHEAFLWKKDDGRITRDFAT